MNINVMYSKKTDDWKTPSKIYNNFIAKGYIDTFRYQSETDQFKLMYEKQKIFMNPPFSKLKLIPDYIKKLIEHKNTIALLIPARTDTEYFHQLLDLNPTICFIKGRLHYNESKSAPFPTILMMFGPYKVNIWCKTTRKKLENEI